MHDKLEFHNILDNFENFAMLKCYYYSKVHCLQSVYSFLYGIELDFSDVMYLN